MAKCWLRRGVGGQFLRNVHPSWVAYKYYARSSLLQMTCSIAAYQLKWRICFLDGHFFLQITVPRLSAQQWISEVNPSSQMVSFSPYK